MSVLTERDVFEIEREGPSLWWLFLVTGIGWVLVSFMVLTFDPTTPATIGYLAGFVLLAAGVNEFVPVRVRQVTYLGTFVARHGPPAPAPPAHATGP